MARDHRTRHKKAWTLGRRQQPRITGCEEKGRQRPLDTGRAGRRKRQPVVTGRDMGGWQVGYFRTIGNEQVTSHNHRMNREKQVPAQDHGMSRHEQVHPAIKMRGQVRRTRVTGHGGEYTTARGYRIKSKVTKVLGHNVISMMWALRY